MSSTPSISDLFTTLIRNPTIVCDTLIDHVTSKEYYINETVDTINEINSTGYSYLHEALQNHKYDFARFLIQECFIDPSIYPSIRQQRNIIYILIEYTTVFTSTIYELLVTFLNMNIKPDLYTTPSTLTLLLSRAADTVWFIECLRVLGWSIFSSSQPRFDQSHFERHYAAICSRSSLYLQNRHFYIRIFDLLSMMDTVKTDKTVPIEFVAFSKFREVAEIYPHELYTPCWLTYSMLKYPTEYSILSQELQNQPLSLFCGFLKHPNLAHIYSTSNKTNSQNQNICTTDLSYFSSQELSQLDSELEEKFSTLIQRTKQRQFALSITITPDILHSILLYEITLQKYDILSTSLTSNQFLDPSTTSPEYFEQLEYYNSIRKEHLECSSNHLLNSFSACGTPTLSLQSVPHFSECCPHTGNKLLPPLSNTSNASLSLLLYWNLRFGQNLEQVPLDKIVTGWKWTKSSISMEHLNVFKYAFLLALRAVVSSSGRIVCSFDLLPSLASFDPLVAICADHNKPLQILLSLPFDQTDVLLELLNFVLQLLAQSHFQENPLLDSLPQISEDSEIMGLFDDDSVFSQTMSQNQKIVTDTHAKVTKFQEKYKSHNNQLPSQNIAKPIGNISCDPISLAQFEHLLQYCSFHSQFDSPSVSVNKTQKAEAHHLVGALPTYYRSYKYRRSYSRTIAQITPPAKASTSPLGSINLSFLGIKPRLFQQCYDKYISTSSIHNQSTNLTSNALNQPQNLDSGEMNENNNEIITLDKAIKYNLFEHTFGISPHNTAIIATNADNHSQLGVDLFGNVFTPPLMPDGEVKGAVQLFHLLSFQTLFPSIFRQIHGTLNSNWFYFSKIAYPIYTGLRFSHQKQVLERSVLFAAHYAPLLSTLYVNNSNLLSEKIPIDYNIFAQLPLWILGSKDLRFVNWLVYQLQLYWSTINKTNSNNYTTLPPMSPGLEESYRHFGRLTPFFTYYFQRFLQSVDDHATISQCIKDSLVLPQSKTLKIHPFDQFSRFASTSTYQLPQGSSLALNSIHHLVNVVMANEYISIEMKYTAVQFILNFTPSKRPIYFATDPDVDLIADLKNLSLTTNLPTPRPKFNKDSTNPLFLLRNLKRISTHLDVLLTIPGTIFHINRLELKDSLMPSTNSPLELSKNDYVHFLQQHPHIVPCPAISTETCSSYHPTQFKAYAQLYRSDLLSIEVTYNIVPVEHDLSSTRLWPNRFALNNLEIATDSTPTSISPSEIETSTKSPLITSATCLEDIILPPTDHLTFRPSFLDFSQRFIVSYPRSNLSSQSLRRSHSILDAPPPSPHWTGENQNYSHYASTYTRLGNNQEDSDNSNHTLRPQPDNRVIVKQPIFSSFSQPTCTLNAIHQEDVFVSKAKHQCQIERDHYFDNSPSSSSNLPSSGIIPLHTTSGYVLTLKALESFYSLVNLMGFTKITPKKFFSTEPIPRETSYFFSSDEQNTFHHFQNSEFYAHSKQIDLMNLSNSIEFCETPNVKKPSVLTASTQSTPFNSDLDSMQTEKGRINLTIGSQNPLDRIGAPLYSYHYELSSKSPSEAFLSENMDDTAQAILKNDTTYESKLKKYQIPNPKFLPESIPKVNTPFPTSMALVKILTTQAVPENSSKLSLLHPSIDLYNFQRPKLPPLTPKSFVKYETTRYNPFFIQSNFDVLGVESNMAPFTHIFPHVEHPVSIDLPQTSLGSLVLLPSRTPIYLTLLKCVSNKNELFVALRLLSDSLHRYLCSKFTEYYAFVKVAIDVHNEAIQFLDQIASSIEQLDQASKIQAITSTSHPQLLYPKNHVPEWVLDNIFANGETNCFAVSAEQKKLLHLQPKRQSLFSTPLDSTKFNLPYKIWGGVPIKRSPLDSTTVDMQISAFFSNYFFSSTDFSLSEGPHLQQDSIWATENDLYKPTYEFEVSEKGLAAQILENTHRIPIQRKSYHYLANNEPIPIYEVCFQRDQSLGNNNFQRIKSIYSLTAPSRRYFYPGGLHPEYFDDENINNYNPNTNQNPYLANAIARRVSCSNVRASYYNQGIHSIAYELPPLRPHPSQLQSNHIQHPPPPPPPPSSNSPLCREILTREYLIKPTSPDYIAARIKHGFSSEFSALEAENAKSAIRALSEQFIPPINLMTPIPELPKDPFLSPITSTTGATKTTQTIAPLRDVILSFAKQLKQYFTTLNQTWEHQLKEVYKKININATKHSFPVNIPDFLSDSKVVPMSQLIGSQRSFAEESLFRFLTTRFTYGFHISHLLWVHRPTITLYSFFKELIKHNFNTMHTIIQPDEFQSYTGSTLSRYNFHLTATSYRYETIRHRFNIQKAFFPSVPPIHDHDSFSQHRIKSPSGSFIIPTQVPYLFSTKPKGLRESTVPNQPIYECLPSSYHHFYHFDIHPTVSQISEAPSQSISTHLSHLVTRLMEFDSQSIVLSNSGLRPSVSFPYSDSSTPSFELLDHLAVKDLRDYFNHKDLKLICQNSPSVDSHHSKNSLNLFSQYYQLNQFQNYFNIDQSNKLLLQRYIHSLHYHPETGSFQFDQRELWDTLFQSIHCNENSLLLHTTGLYGTLDTISFEESVEFFSFCKDAVSHSILTLATYFSKKYNHIDSNVQFIDDTNQHYQLFLLWAKFAYFSLFYFAKFSPMVHIHATVTDAPDIIHPYYHSPFAITLFQAMNDIFPPPLVSPSLSLFTSQAKSLTSISTTLSQQCFNIFTSILHYGPILVQTQPLEAKRAFIEISQFSRKDSLIAQSNFSKLINQFSTTFFSGFFPSTHQSTVPTTTPQLITIPLYNLLPKCIQIPYVSTWLRQYKHDLISYQPFHQLTTQQIDTQVNNVEFVIKQRIWLQNISLSLNFHQDLHCAVKDGPEFLPQFRAEEFLFPFTASLDKLAFVDPNLLSLPTHHRFTPQITDAMVYLNKLLTQQDGLQSPSQTSNPQTPQNILTDFEREFYSLQSQQLNTTLNVITKNILFVPYRHIYEAELMQSFIFHSTWFQVNKIYHDLVSKLISAAKDMILLLQDQIGEEYTNLSQKPSKDFGIGSSFVPLSYHAFTKAFSVLKTCLPQDEIAKLHEFIPEEEKELDLNGTAVSNPIDDFKQYQYYKTFQKQTTIAYLNSFITQLDTFFISLESYAQSSSNPPIYDLFSSDPPKSPDSSPKSLRKFTTPPISPIHSYYSYFIPALQKIHQLSYIYYTLSASETSLNSPPPLLVAPSLYRRQPRSTSSFAGMLLAPEKLQPISSSHPWALFINHLDVFPERLEKLSDEVILKKENQLLDLVSQRILSLFSRSSPESSPQTFSQSFPQSSPQSSLLSKDTNEHCLNVNLIKNTPDSYSNSLSHHLPLLFTHPITLIPASFIPHHISSMQTLISNFSEADGINVLESHSPRLAYGKGSILPQFHMITNNPYRYLSDFTLSSAASIGALSFITCFSVKALSLAAKHHIVSSLHNVYFSIESSTPLISFDQMNEDFSKTNTFHAKQDEILLPQQPNHAINLDIVPDFSLHSSSSCDSQHSSSDKQMPTNVVYLAPISQSDNATQKNYQYHIFPISDLTSIAMADLNRTTISPVQRLFSIPLIWLLVHNNLFAEKSSHDSGTFYHRMSPSVVPLFQFLIDHLGAALDSAYLFTQEGMALVLGLLSQLMTKVPNGNGIRLVQTIIERSSLYFFSKVIQSQQQVLDKDDDHFGILPLASYYQTPPTITKLFSLTSPTLLHLPPTFRLSQTKTFSNSDTALNQPSFLSIPTLSQLQSHIPSTSFLTFAQQPYYREKAFQSHFQNIFTFFNSNIPHIGSILLSFLLHFGDNRSVLENSLIRSSWDHLEQPTPISNIHLELVQQILQEFALCPSSPHFCIFSSLTKNNSFTTLQPYATVKLRMMTSYTDEDAQKIILSVLLSSSLPPPMAYPYFIPVDFFNKNFTHHRLHQLYSAALHLSSDFQKMILDIFTTNTNFQDLSNYYQILFPTTRLKKYWIEAQEISTSSTPNKHHRFYSFLAANIIQTGFSPETYVSNWRKDSNLLLLFKPIQSSEHAMAYSILAAYYNVQIMSSVTLSVSFNHLLSPLLSNQYKQPYLPLSTNLFKTPLDFPTPTPPKQVPGTPSFFLLSDFVGHHSTGSPVLSLYTLVNWLCPLSLSLFAFGQTTPSYYQIRVIQLLTQHLKLPIVNYPFLHSYLSHKFPSPNRNTFTILQLMKQYISPHLSLYSLTKVDQWLDEFEKLFKPKYHDINSRLHDLIKDDDTTSASVIFSGFTGDDASPYFLPSIYSSNFVPEEKSSHCFAFDSSQKYPSFEYHHIRGRFAQLLASSSLAQSILYHCQLPELNSIRDAAIVALSQNNISIVTQFMNKLLETQTQQYITDQFQTSSIYHRYQSHHQSNPPQLVNFPYVSALEDNYTPSESNNFGEKKLYSRFKPIFIRIFTRFDNKKLFNCILEADELDSLTSFWKDQPHRSPDCSHFDFCKQARTTLPHPALLSSLVQLHTHHIYTDLGTSIRQLNEEYSQFDKIAICSSNIGDQDGHDIINEDDLLYDTPSKLGDGGYDYHRETFSGTAPQLEHKRHVDVHFISHPISSSSASLIVDLPPLIIEPLPQISQLHSSSIYFTGKLFTDSLIIDPNNDHGDFCYSISNINYNFSIKQTIFPSTVPLFIRFLISSGFPIQLLQSFIDIPRLSTIIQHSHGHIPSLPTYDPDSIVINQNYLINTDKYDPYLWHSWQTVLGANSRTKQSLQTLEWFLPTSSALSEFFDNTDTIPISQTPHSSIVSTNLPASSSTSQSSPRPHKHLVSTLDLITHSTHPLPPTNIYQSPLAALVSQPITMISIYFKFFIHEYLAQYHRILSPFFDPFDNLLKDFDIEQDNFEKHQEFLSLLSGLSHSVINLSSLLQFIAEYDPQHCAHLTSPKYMKLVSTMMSYEPTSFDSMPNFTLTTFGAICWCGKSPFLQNNRKINTSSLTSHQYIYPSPFELTCMNVPLHPIDFQPFPTPISTTLSQPEHLQIPSLTFSHSSQSCQSVQPQTKLITLNNILDFLPPEHSLLREELFNFLSANQSPPEYPCLFCHYNVHLLASATFPWSDIVTQLQSYHIPYIDETQLTNISSALYHNYSLDYLEFQDTLNKSHAKKQLLPTATNPFDNIIIPAHDLCHPDATSTSDIDSEFYKSPSNFSSMMGNLKDVDADLRTSTQSTISHGIINHTPSTFAARFLHNSSNNNVANLLSPGPMQSKLSTSHFTDDTDVATSPPQHIHPPTTFPLPSIMFDEENDHPSPPLSTTDLASPFHSSVDILPRIKQPFPLTCEQLEKIALYNDYLYQQQNYILWSKNFLSYPNHYSSIPFPISANATKQHYFSATQIQDFMIDHMKNLIQSSNHFLNPREAMNYTTQSHHWYQNTANDLAHPDILFTRLHITPRWPENLSSLDESRHNLPIPLSKLQYANSNGILNYLLTTLNSISFTIDDLVSLLTDSRLCVSACHQNTNALLPLHLAIMYQYPNNFLLALYNSSLSSSTFSGSLESLLQHTDVNGQRIIDYVYTFRVKEWALEFAQVVENDMLELGFNISKL